MKMPHVARENETNGKTQVQKRKVRLCATVTADELRDGNRARKWRVKAI